MNKYYITVKLDGKYISSGPAYGENEIDAMHKYMQIYLEEVLLHGKIGQNNLELEIESLDIEDDSTICEMLTKYSNGVT